MRIREEGNRDFEIIYNIIKISFQSAEYADGNEHDLVNRLRKSNAYIPKLSLVAEINNKIVGHIMFTKVKIGDSIQLALAPFDVPSKNFMAYKLIENTSDISGVVQYTKEFGI